MCQWVGRMDGRTQVVSAVRGRQAGAGCKRCLCVEGPAAVEEARSSGLGTMPAASAAEAAEAAAKASAAAAAAASLLLLAGVVVVAVAVVMVPSGLPRPSFGAIADNGGDDDDETARKAIRSGRDASDVRAGRGQQLRASRSRPCTTVNISTFQFKVQYSCRCFTAPPMQARG
jgi:hypothetical protein